MGSTIHPYTYLCSELVTVISFEGTGNHHVMSGTLEEIGREYARVLVDSPYLRGAQITVNANGHCFKGRVTSWSFEPLLGYFIDVELAPESQWSPKRFRPQHLLRIPKVMNHAETTAA